MDDVRSVRLSGDRLDEFLAPGGTGVISFGSGADRPPHSIPVSYGYDAVERAFYFRLALGPDAGKDEVLDDRPVSFVTAEETESGWRSVVATGRLEEVAEAEMASAVVQGLQRVHIPLVDVFDRHPSELPFRFFRLDPAELTGRREARGED